MSIEEKAAKILAELHASEQRQAYWLQEWAKRYENGDDGAIYDKARAVEIEVRQHLRSELAKVHRLMFNPE